MFNAHNSSDIGRRCSKAAAGARTTLSYSALLACFLLSGIAPATGGDPPAQQTPEEAQEVNPLAELHKNPLFGVLRNLVEGGEKPSGAAPASHGSTMYEPMPEATPLDSSSLQINDEGLIEIHVRDTDISAVLEMLSYQARTNIVATKSVRGIISANLYGLTLSEALDAILTPNGFVYKASNKTIFVGTADELATPAQAQQPVTRVFRLRYIMKDEAVAVVASVLSDIGKVTAGGAEESSFEDSDDIFKATEAGIDYIIVTDTPARLEGVAALLRDIDIRPKQALIEATILRATLNEDNQFGIDFTMLGGVDFQNVNGVSNASADMDTGNTPAARFEQTTFNVNTNMIGNMPAGGFTLGIIRNSVATFVRALEDVTDVTVVANPKIIALNKQKSSVIVGRRDGYITTTVTETAAVQTVEFLETGTQITFRPFINADGTVRLAVHPKDSNGGLTAANLPFEETTESESAIMVDDGRTVLIGGLFRERTVNSKSQLPLLGDIPGAGLLFQYNSNTTVREEVIILLTVHVLKETDEEYDKYAALLEDVERVRVGSRMGLMGSGRDRLAQAFYQQALRKAEQGETDRALLCTRMALHNAPKHMAALKLKERLLGRRIWENDGTRTHVFLMDLIRQEQTSLEETDRSELFGRPPVDLKIHRDGPIEEFMPKPDDESPVLLEEQAEVKEEATVEEAEQ